MGATPILILRELAQLIDEGLPRFSGLPFCWGIRRDELLELCEFHPNIINKDRMTPEKSTAKSL